MTQQERIAELRKENFNLKNTCDELYAGSQGEGLANE